MMPSELFVEECFVFQFSIGADRVLGNAANLSPAQLLIDFLSVATCFSVESLYAPS